MSHFKEYYLLTSIKSVTFILFYPLTTSPPLGCKTCPLIYRESSLAKNKKHGATSFGIPARFIGESLPNSAFFFGLNEEAISGVQIGPGATALTLIPLSIRLTERLLVKEIIAPFVAE